MIRLKNITLIIVMSLFLITTGSALAQNDVTEEAISPATWIAVVLLLMLIVIGIILARVKANKNKEQIRELMAEMKEE